jgi:ankyrin repeat protein
VVDLLLERVNLDHKDKAGRTPLSWAAENGREEAVLTLLALLGSKRVDVDSLDLNHRSPLSWAAENGWERVVLAILENKGFDASPKDPNDRSP